MYRDDLNAAHHVIETQKEKIAGLESEIEVFQVEQKLQRRVYNSIDYLIAFLIAAVALVVGMAVTPIEKTKSNSAIFIVAGPVEIKSTYFDDE